MFEWWLSIYNPEYKTIPRIARAAEGLVIRANQYIDDSYMHHYEQDY